jgi:predicted HTH transcriptional regulator
MQGEGKVVSRYITNLIGMGEGLTLDFKHSINDSKKIARSLAAFANTQGGTLLVGVKDNGSIAGVNTDEEFYMVEAASTLYCKPEVPFEVARWNVNSKTVLEVKVKPSKLRPHKAPDKNGHYKAYIRVADENMVVTPTQLRIWKAERSRLSIGLNLSRAQTVLFEYLKQNPRITVDEFSKLGFLSTTEAERILVNLTVIGTLRYSGNPAEEYFCFPV